MPGGKEYWATLALRFKDEASPGLKKTEAAALQSGGALNKLAHYAKLGAAGYAALAVATVATTAKFATHGNIVKRNYEQLGSLVGGFDEARTMMDIAAKATGNLANKQELLPSVMRLVNMGLINNASDTERVIQLTGKMAGIAVKTVPEAVEALVNALASGRTTGLRPFGFDTEKLSARVKELGEQFPEMSQKERMWIAIQEQMDAVIAKGGDNVWNFSQAMQACKNIMIDWANDLSMQLTPALDEFGRMVQAVMPRVMADVEAAFSRLVPFFAGVMEEITKAVRSFVDTGALSVVLQTLMTLFEQVGYTLRQLIPIFSEVGNSLIVVLGPAFNNLIMLLGQLTQIVIAFVGLGLYFLLGVIEGIAPALDRFITALRNIANTIMELLAPNLDDANARARSLGQTLGEFLGGALDLVTRGLEWLCAQIAPTVQWFRDFWGVIGPIVTQFGEQLWPILVQIGQALWDIGSIILSILIPNFQGFGIGGQEAGNKVAPAIIWIKDTIVELAAKASEKLTAVKNWLLEHKTTIEEKLKPAWEGMKAFVFDAVSFIIEVLIGLSQIMSGDVSTGFQTIRTACSEHLGAMPQDISDIFGGQISPATVTALALLLLVFKGGGGFGGIAPLLGLALGNNPDGLGGVMSQGMGPSGPAQTNAGGGLGQLLQLFSGQQGMGAIPGIGTTGMTGLGGAFGQSWPGVHQIFGGASGAGNLLPLLSTGMSLLPGGATTGLILLGIAMAAGWGLLHGDWGRFSQELDNILNDKMEPLPQTVDTHTGKVQAGITAFFTTMLTGWGMDWDTAHGIVNTTMIAINGTVGGGLKIVEGTIGAGGTLIHGATGTIRKLMEGDFAGAWDEIKRTATELFKKDGDLDKIMQGVFQVVDSTIGQCMRNLGLAVDLSWENIKATVEYWANSLAIAALETLGRLVTDIPNQFIDIGNGIINALNTAIRGVVDFVNSIINAINWVIEKIGLTNKIDIINADQFMIGTASHVENPIHVPEEWYRHKNEAWAIMNKPKPYGWGPAMATGGLVEKAGWALIGERGPELMKFGAGDMVFSNNELNKFGRTLGIETGAVPGVLSGRLGMSPDAPNSNMAYGKGGLWEDIVGQFKDVGSWLGEHFSDLMDWVGKGASWVVEKAFEAMGVKLPVLPENFLGVSGNGFAQGVFDFIKGKIVEWVNKIIAEISARIAAMSSSATSGLQWYPFIKKYFPESEWRNAFRVMLGESGGNPGAIGDHGSSIGLFQIRWDFPGRPSREQLLNPEFNVAYAAELFRNEGWRPWTVAGALGLVPGWDPGYGIPDWVRTADPEAMLFAQMATAGVSGGGTIDWNWAKYGYCPPAFGPITNTAHAGYTAVDIGVPMGAPIYAATSGTVMASGWSNVGYGNFVQLHHDDGLGSLYAHLQASLVSLGQHVSEGQQIALADSTGNSTGPHLHFEIRTAKQGADFIARHPELMMVGDAIGPEYVSVTPLAEMRKGHGVGGGQEVHYHLNYTAVRKEPSRADAVRAMRELEFLARTRS